MVNHNCFHVNRICSDHIFCILAIIIYQIINKSSAVAVFINIWERRLVGLIWKRYCIKSSFGIFCKLCGGSKSFILCFRSALSIYSGHFCLKNARTTPYTSLVRARYRVSFVSAKPDRSFTIVIALLCPLSTCIWPCCIKSDSIKINDF